MPGEQRDPAVGISSNKMGGRGGMIKPSINLQDLRRRIYVKVKADFGWNRWSRNGLYQHKYYPVPKVLPA